MITTKRKTMLVCGFLALNALAQAAGTVIIVNKTKLSYLTAYIVKGDILSRSACLGPQKLDPNAGPNQAFFANISQCDNMRHAEVRPGSGWQSRILCFDDSNNVDLNSSHDYQFEVDYNEQGTYSCIGKAIN